MKYSFRHQLESKNEDSDEEESEEQHDNDNNKNYPSHYDSQQEKLTEGKYFLFKLF